MTKHNKTFQFSQKTVNIFDLQGKDLDFLETPIMESAKNNKEALAFMDDLARKGVDLVNTVIKFTKQTIEEGEYDQVQLSYLAGFLDSDGTINVSTSRTAKKAGYRFPFKAQLTVSFIQKDRRKEFLEAFKECFGGAGNIRQMKSGVCEYNITDEQVIVPLLKLLLPYLRVKKRQAALAILFTEFPKKLLSVSDYFLRAMLVDVLCSYNDSKNHQNTAKKIKDELVKANLLSAEDLELTRFVV